MQRHSRRVACKQRDATSPKAAQQIAHVHTAGAKERLEEARNETVDLNVVHATALRRNEELEMALRETSAALRSLQASNDECISTYACDIVPRPRGMQHAQRRWVS